MATAFPELMSGDDLVHYSKVQVPVAILGALFDSLSLYITLLVVRNALRSRSNFSYISHLSIDVLIAIAATFLGFICFFGFFRLDCKFHACRSCRSQTCSQK